MSKIKDLLPPFFIRILQSLFLFKVQWKGNYNSFQQAANVCKGYEDPKLIDMIFEQAKVFRDDCLEGRLIQVNSNIVQTLMGLCLSGEGKDLNVIDFGGSFGGHYFMAKAVLKEKYNLKWCVVETTATVTRANYFANEELFFFDDINLASKKLGRVDLIYSSGTLQFLPQPYEMLKAIIEIKAKYLFLIRFPLLLGDEERYAIQYSKYSANTAGPLPEGIKEGVAEYPINFLSKNKVEAIISEKYKINFIMDEAETFTYRFKALNAYGYWAILKNGAV